MMDPAIVREEVENIPLYGVNEMEPDNRVTEVNHNVNLRRTRTDVHMSPRNQQGHSKCHSYSGQEYRQQSTLPSRYGGEYLGSHSHHYGSSCRPSAWFNTVIARRRRGVTPHTEEETVDEITEAMEGDEKLMSDDVDGEIMRRETVRELSKPLRVKKEIRRRLTARRSSTRAASHNISGFKQFKYSMSMYWYKVRQSVEDTFHDYSLWHKELKEIEGMFGTGVGSYFRFLRYLFILNFVITVLVCGFLLTPQLLQRMNSEGVDSDIGNNKSESSASFSQVGHNTLALNIQEKSVFDVDNIVDKISCQPNAYLESFNFLDLITGAGWFSNAELYYGTYTNCSISLVDGQIYNMPGAYFFLVFVAFCVYLIAILHRVIVLYKNNYIDTEHDVTSTFVKKVFSSWDFTITERKAANIKHRSIYNELTELLQELQCEDSDEDLCTRSVWFAVKLGFWALIIGFLALMGWAMYIMLNEDISSSVEGSGMHLLVYPLIVTVIMIIVPALFEGLVNIEGYKIPRHRLYVTLIRTIMLMLTVLSVLVGFWYLQERTQEDENTCWETSLGQEIYRLLFIDFIVALVVQMALIIFFIITSRRKLEGVLAYIQEFNVARNTLHLIYNQTLLWAGLFFCPLTPVIVLLKIAIIFYIQKFTILKFLQPDDRPWRAAQTETVFFALTLVSLILSFIGYGFITVRGDASHDCGPFRNYDHYIDFLWDLTNSNQQTVLSVISWIFKPGVVAGILGILILLVYCAKSMAEGRAEMINVLRKQLELEMRDRAFLLQLTDRVCRGDYRPTITDDSQRVATSSSTRDLHSLTQRGSFVFTETKGYHDNSDLNGRPFYGSLDCEEGSNSMPQVST
ncbi:transmembrane channel-like protein 7 isoform X1 [Penaeus chinensis]|uniref:transmembrane channel-like protein 7 isoform X1 n=1 Tax=Penaeus chinensis TaxID=139456 RepID=UPI001FB6EF7B|nr:transmembrane channel-like protein 7 isoform X1 [Penaeus chinensis]XP_047493060.1 transmembrane channel-like protein 7 isoform X1 [Penaeus chinensis]XP_047493061.1 transmembrane channel-like protein 7 isoform X1 [Penaeus chinensis]XP_047493062.1 transmembrane channel-like protein 7 isoform X1 [Penaeus chinensis]